MPDTNVWVDFLNPGANVVKKQLQVRSFADIATCSVVKAELYYGAARSAKKSENTEILDGLFARMKSLPFDDIAAQKYASVRAYLAAQGTPIGPHDLMISAIALVNDLTVVTHNTKEFSRVPNLRIEDWEIPPTPNTNAENP